MRGVRVAGKDEGADEFKDCFVALLLAKTERDAAPLLATTEKIMIATLPLPLYNHRPPERNRRKP